MPSVASRLDGAVAFLYSPPMLTYTHIRRRAAGFNLIELMVTLSVAGVLLGIAIPSFTDVIRSNQIAAQSNQLMSALALARSESVKRGTRVSVCAANTCGDASATPDWVQGWTVFADDFGTAGVIDPSDVVIQSWPRVTNSVNVAGTAAVTFARTGRAEFARSFNIVKSGCGKGQKRDISVGLSGRVSFAKSDC
jgi:type IV fimbrial biogenesis protein FimT